MRILLLLFVTVFSQSACAEVFKCVGKNGMVKYQPAPCASAIKQQQLEIKSDPEKEAAAKAKLEEVRNEYDSRKALQQEAAKNAAEQHNKAATLDAAQRSAIAQQEQAEALHRQAEALEHENDDGNRVLIMPPPAMPGMGYDPRY